LQNFAEHRITYLEICLLNRMEGLAAGQGLGPGSGRNSDGSEKSCPAFAAHVCTRLSKYVTNTSTLPDRQNEEASAPGRSDLSPRLSLDSIGWFKKPLSFGRAARQAESTGTPLFGAGRLWLVDLFLGLFSCSTGPRRLPDPPLLADLREIHTILSGRVLEQFTIWGPALRNI
jgi:hypothetical protein